MTWTELLPKELDDLYVILNRVADSQNFVFRGQASRQWAQLSPSLHRVIRDSMSFAEKVLLEARTISAFRRHARSLLHFSEMAYFDMILDGLTLMQHYGAPTRLLDWTLSPWVAAYFAADMEGVDGVTWAFNRAKLERIYGSSGSGGTPSRSSGLAKFQKLVTAKTVEDWAVAALGPSTHINTFRYQFANPQMSAQQSLFTISGTLGEDHEIAIGRVLRLPEDKLRIVVPASLKKTVRQRLFLMNVNALSLFPSLDGVGRQISEAVRSNFSLGDDALLWILKSRVK